MSDHPSVVAVDVGGTFTDCVAWSPGGVTIAKVPTTSDQSQGVVAGAGRLAPEKATTLLHGTTVATNALLERRGADTVLLTDPGFEDVIEIGRQDRPSLYDSFADRPRPLVARDDRMGVEDSEAAARWVAERNPESVAVALAYSFSDPDGEISLARALEGMDVAVSLSHRVAAEFREFERTSTTVLDAYLQPRVGGYLSALSQEAGGVADRIQVMRSSGGLMEVQEASGLAAALLLSGPAGGVVAASEMGRARGYSRLVTFDMGGTSTDVCRIEAGRPEIAYQREVAGFVCRMPSVAVHTVGAGGGSVGWVDPGGSLRVGPRSAGASPGPAAYGRGGSEPTVTDAHLSLGRIDPGGRLGGTLRLHPELARRAVAALADRLGLTPRAAAEGMLEVVEAHMSRAIRNVSVEQGADPRPATLVAFGGAGGLHATALARRLGMARVAIPPHGGVFSALGLLMAPPRRDGARSVLLTGPAGFRESVAEVGGEVDREYRRFHGGAPVERSRRVDMRYRGQAHEIAVPVEDGEGWEDAVARFHRLHAEINGFARPEDPVEVVTVRAVAQGRPLLRWEDLPAVGRGSPPRPRRRGVIMSGEETEAEIWWRSDLPADWQMKGPAVIEEEVGTTVLGPGDRAVVADDGTVEVTWE
ncbi:MAG: hydantoinase/oxoprolinase family protein [Actinomycetota bacterium]